MYLEQPNARSREPTCFEQVELVKLRGLA